MYPVRRSVRRVTGDAALLEDEGTGWLFYCVLARGRAHGPLEVLVRVPGTHHKLSGGVGGSSSVPREVTSKK